VSIYLERLVHLHLLFISFLYHHRDEGLLLVGSNLLL